MVFRRILLERKKALTAYPPLLLYTYFFGPEDDCVSMSDYKTVRLRFLKNQCQMYGGSCCLVLDIKEEPEYARCNKHLFRALNNADV